MFRGCPQQTGVAGSPLPPELKLRWRHVLAVGTSCTAAIADAVAYLGDDDGNLLALDLLDGRRLWTFAGEDTVESSPTVIDVAIDPPPAPAVEERGVDSGPARASRRLVLYGDEAGMVRALNAADGKPVWHFETGDRVVSSVNVAGDRVVFGSYDGFVYCLRSSDGVLLWKYDVEERIHGTPAVVDGYALAAGCDSRLHVINLADGTAERRIDMGSVSGSAPAICGDRVYLGMYGQHVLAIDWRAGDLVWRFQDRQREFPFLSSAAVTANAILIGGRDKRLRALDPATGRPIWEFATRGRVDSSPVVVGERVFVGSTDGNLYSIDLGTGRELWRFETGADIHASPAVGQGCLVIGNEEGVVYCFGGAP